MEENLNIKNENQLQAQPGLVDFINLQMGIKSINVNTLSPLALAFIGDSVYDLVIRTIVIEQGNTPVYDMHKKCSNFVEASSQARLYKAIKDDLSEEEGEIFKRGRNAKSKTQAKNASKSNYRTATGLETLIGYLYLTDDFPRILELMKLGLEKMNI